MQEKWTITSTGLMFFYIQIDSQNFTSQQGTIHINDFTFEMHRKDYDINIY